MPADVPATAGVSGVLSHDPKRDRVARSEVSLGLRFVAAGHAVHDTGSEFSLQSFAAGDGRNDALAGPADSAIPRHGSGAAKDDEVHAVDVFVHFIQLFSRLDAVLD